LVYLKDNELDVVHNLSQSAYTFESQAGEFNERFEIVYMPDGTMGVDDLTANGVMIYKNNGNIEISSKNSKITEVELFDLQGRKVFNKAKVNSNLLQI